MSGDHEDFAAWLRERAASVGFDTTKRGMISRLAEASGVDTGQMSRFLRGQALPAIDGQRGIAKALKVKLPEVMIRAGSAEPDDFSPGEDGLTLTDVAEALVVPASKRAEFVDLVVALAHLAKDASAAQSTLPHIRAIVDALNRP